VKLHNWVIITWLLINIARAQTPFDIYDPQYDRGLRSGRPADDSLVCAWPKVGLRETPGRGGEYLQTIYFGERIRKISNEERSSGGRDYIYVETRSGNAGWVYDYLFIEGGGLVTLLENKTIYDSPSAVSATTETFRAGELLILSNYQGGNWVELISSEKKRTGWVKGIDEVSYNDIDIKFAKLLRDALAEENETKRLRELEKIRRMPDLESSAFEPIITYATLDYNTSDREVVIRDPITDEIIYFDDGSGELVSNVEMNEQEVVVEKVIDMETGKYYNRITETGKIAEVDGPQNPETIYWAYHKTRPVGSKILLHVPEGGYLQLEVVARLRKNNPASIGLGKNLLESVYGTRFAKWSTFSYPQ